MKRKLVNFEIFEEMQKNSLTAAEMELQEASPIIAAATGADELELVSFGQDNVIYENLDGTYVQANYEIKNGKIFLENISQLVVDEESEVTHRKEKISEMVDAILDSKSEKASSIFSEIAFKVTSSKPKSGDKKRKSSKRGKTIGGSSARKSWITRRKNKKKFSTDNPGVKAQIDRVADREKRKLGRKPRTTKGTQHIRTYTRFGKNMKEWTMMVENVFDYVDYKTYGPVLKESVVSRDEDGNVVALQIPTMKLRNEAKLLSFDWKTPDTKVTVLRNGAKMIGESENFCKAVAELKRHNALSDSNALEETLGDIVSKWSDIIYLTENELSKMIKKSLDTIGTKNYDDQTCQFMAEGILRTAHEIYTEKVAAIITMAGQTISEESEDQYADFRKVADELFSNLDESNMTEMQVYVDLYNALREVYQGADSDALLDEAEMHLSELAAIINKEIAPSLDVAADAADFLADVIEETNLNTKDWQVSNSTHTSINGDHPAMKEKANSSYTPSRDFSGDYNDPAPVSDGDWRIGKGSDDAEEMRGRSHGNIGGNDTYPSLNNPYVPKPYGDYTMKNEKGVDKDNDPNGQWGSGDTWPNLKNPYVPQAVTPQPVTE